MMYEIQNIQIEKIKAGEYEQRIGKEDAAIDELANSIRRVGVISPIIVIQQGDTFLLVAGHRRLLAAERLGLSSVPCIVKDSTGNSCTELSFAENFFRKDLTPVELACAIKDCYKHGIMKIPEIAAGFHRTEHWVKEQLAICDWPADVLEAVHEGEMSVSAAANLACVTDDHYRTFLVRQACEGGATARTTAAWLQAWRSMMPPEQAIEQEDVPGKPVPKPLVPQSPCFCCGQVHSMNELSHVPICSGCISAIRSA